MSNVSGIDKDALLNFIERIESLEEEKSAVAENIKEVKAELKECGFDSAIVSQILKLRKMDEAVREEQESMLELYKLALDMA